MKKLVIGSLIEVRKHRTPYNTLHKPYSLLITTPLILKYRLFFSISKNHSCQWRTHPLCDTHLFLIQSDYFNLCLFLSFKQTIDDSLIGVSCKHPSFEHRLQLFCLIFYSLEACLVISEQKMCTENQNIDHNYHRTTCSCNIYVKTV